MGQVKGQSANHRSKGQVKGQRANYSQCFKRSIGLCCDGQNSLQREKLQIQDEWYSNHHESVGRMMAIISANNRRAWEINGLKGRITVISGEGRERG